MKSLGPNQKQLIRSQWELYQLIAAGTQRAEVPKAGWIKVIKLSISAVQYRITSRKGMNCLALPAVREAVTWHHNRDGL